MLTMQPILFPPRPEVHYTLRVVSSYDYRVCGVLTCEGTQCIWGQLGGTIGGYTGRSQIMSRIVCMRDVRVGGGHLRLGKHSLSRTDMVANPTYTKDRVP